MSNNEAQIKKLATQIANSFRIVIFTGAGVSTESGISDFRSPGGIWDRYDPEVLDFQHFLSSEENRKIYWQFHRELYRSLKSAKPNAAHYAIVELEKMNKLYSLITQNIDNLHQKAGNDPKKIIELHGNAFKVRCLSCGFLYDRDEIEERLDKGEEVPYCTKCKGILKPATISFGQAMPEKETREAFRRASECELLIVLGSSLVVYPAASIPLEAVACGAKLGIINLTPTPYDGYAEVVIRGRCGEVMKEVMRQVKQMS